MSKKQYGGTNKYDPPQSLDELLRRFKTATIRITSIDFSDRAHCSRDSVVPACSPEDLEPSKSVLELTGQHPVVVEAVGKRMRLVHGFRRAAALRQRSDIRHIRCLVAELKPHETVLVATTINCVHGDILGTTERRNAFVRAYQAHKQAGLPPLADADWHRRFKCSKSTVPEWIALAEGTADAAEDADLPDEPTFDLNASRPTIRPTGDADDAAEAPAGAQSMHHAESRKSPGSKRQKRGRAGAGTGQRTCDDAIEDLEVAAREISVDFGAAALQPSRLGRIRKVRDELAALDQAEAAR